MEGVRADIERIKDEIDGATTLEKLFQVTHGLAEDEFKVDAFDHIANYVPEPILDNEDFASDLKVGTADFNTFAKNILDRLIKLADDVAIEDNSMLNVNALKCIKEQLLNNAVYMCVIGKYNSGKTMFINALLGKDILPVSMSPETATTLYIEHSKHKNARLINRGTLRQEQGSEERITEFLRRQHLSIRGSSLRKSEEYLLKMNVPLLATTENGPTPFLVDTPGSDEVLQEDLQNVAELSLKSAAAYVYVMKYDDCQGKSSYKPFRLIYSRDPKIFQDERMTIVVTHFDRYYGDEGGLGYDDLRRTIADKITEYLKCGHISPDIIYPVCSKWACMVKRFETTNHTAHFNDICTSVCSVLSTKAKIQGSKSCPNISEVISMPRAEWSACISDVSGMDKVTTRLARVSNNLAMIWRSNIVTGCDSGLENALVFSKQQRDDADKKIEKINTQTEFARKAILYHSQMLANTKQDSDVIRKLKDAYETDTRIAGDLLDRINNMLEESQRRLSDRVRQDRKYSTEKLSQDVDTLQGTMSNEVNVILKQKRFPHCQAMLTKQIQRISEKFGRLRSVAVSTTDSGVPNTLAGIYDNNQVDETEDVGSIFVNEVMRELQSITLEDIVTVTRWQKIILKLPFTSPRIVKNDHIERIINEWRTSITQTSQEYFDQNKDKVLLYFFKIYCQTVCKQLVIFKHDVAKQHNDLNELEDKIRDLGVVRCKKEQCEQLIDHLEKLKRKLMVDYST